MVDLNNLSDVVQIIAGGGAIVAAVYGAYYKWVIAPANKEKAAQAKTLADAVQAIEILKQDLKDSKNQFANDIASLNKSLQKSDDDEQSEIDEIKQDFKDLQNDINDRLKTVDAKNERLLDLIIKYFTDKND